MSSTLHLLYGASVQGLMWAAPYDLSGAATLMWGFQIRQKLLLSEPKDKENRPKLFDIP